MSTPKTKDPELQYFDAKLRHTEEGAKYQRLWNELKLVRIELDQACSNPKFARLIPKLRNRMVTLDEKCSHELANLEATYHWPPG